MKKLVIIATVIAVASMIMAGTALHKASSNLSKMGEAAKIMRGYGIDVGYRGE